MLSIILLVNTNTNTNTPTHSHTGNFLVELKPEVMGDDEEIIKLDDNSDDSDSDTDSDDSAADKDPDEELDRYAEQAGYANEGSVEDAD